MTFKDKLIVYLYKKQNSIEEEYQNHEEFTKFRRKDQNDYLESIILLTRKNLIGELIRDIMVLLNLNPKLK